MCVCVGGNRCWRFYIFISSLHGMSCQRPMVWANTPPLNSFAFPARSSFIFLWEPVKRCLKESTPSLTRTLRQATSQSEGPGLGSESATLARSHWNPEPRFFWSYARLLSRSLKLSGPERSRYWHGPSEHQLSGTARWLGREAVVAAAAAAT